MAAGQDPVSDMDAVVTICDAAEIVEPVGWREYLELVDRWGKRTDLTSARTLLEQAEILFLDAAHLVAAGWCAQASSIVDVGAGVGAPTIPMLLAVPTLRGLLVEPRRIRATFLRTAAGSLGLASRLEVAEQRVDPAAPTVSGMPFDVALSRATFAPAVWRTVGAALATEVWVLTAGAEPEGDTDTAWLRRLDYRVPSSDAPRSVFAYGATDGQTATAP